MWNERYSQSGFAYGTAPNDFLKAHVDRLPTGEVLCLAEGEGRNAVFLAGQGYDVTAVDISEVGGEKTQTLALERKVSVTTICADLTHFPIEPASWNAVISIWAHLPAPARRSLHARVVAGLKSGGAFILEAYTPRQVELGTGGPPEEFTMSLTTLRDELAGLQLEIAHEIEREVQEGKYHSGPSAVVQILAFKP